MNLSIHIESPASRQQAVKAVNLAYEGMWVTIGERPAEPELRKLRGAILTEIAEQAWKDGRQFPSAAWGELYNGLFIGWDEFDLPNGTRIYRPISSNTLMRNRRAYLDYLTKIQSDAAQNYGVRFKERDEFRVACAER